MKSSWSTLLRQAARIVAARRGLDENGEETAESGFTLIELMVVLLILGILLAIAIPTFLGATHGANDKASQSNLTSAINAAKVVLAQHSSSLTKTTAKTEFGTWISAAEPDLKFTSSNPTAVTQVGVAYTNKTEQVILTSWSAATKVCWIIRDRETGDATKAGVSFGFKMLALPPSTTATKGTSATTCTPTVIATGKTAAPSTPYARVWPTAPTGH